MLRLNVCACAVVALLLAAVPSIGSAAARSKETSGALHNPERAAVQQLTPEEELAAKFAPIVYIAQQEAECDRGGDPYEPAPVEIVLDNPNVVLKRDVPGSPVELKGPGAQDLFGKGADFFLDFPGNPRQPGCTYERDYRALERAYAPVAYAHIRTESGFSGLALQYWFFYYFNDWINTHEGDWEMIQLVFDAESASAALQQEPVRVAYAQHEGGETASWEDEKLEKENGRPVVYVAKGSHASYYQAGVYLGVGRHDTGFGCEYASRPHRRVPLEALLLPDQVTDPESPLAWLEFRGRWGELHGATSSGPTGPKDKEQWDKPFTWEQGLRSYSEKLPEGEVLGVDPLRPICTVIETGSSLLNVFVQWPIPVGGAAGLIVVAAVGFLVVGVPRRPRGRPGEPSALPERAAVERGGELFPLRRRRVLSQIGRAAVAVYVQNLWLFLAIAAVFIPLGVAATVVQERLAIDELIDGHVFGPALVFSVGSLQSLVSSLIIGAAVIAALGEIDAGRPAGFWRAYGVVLSRFWRLLGARLRAAFHIALFAVTIIGIPWAMQRAVRWFFVEQAVILDDTSAKEALSRSGDAVSGRWWRTLGILVILAIIVALPGPMIGIALLLFASGPVSDTVYTLNAILYAALLPFVVTAGTLLYFDLGARQETDVASATLD